MPVSSTFTDISRRVALLGERVFSSHGMSELTDFVAVFRRTMARTVASTV